ncbi:MAG: PQQ-binding-like beta-propeller repeat protein, partial [Prosthecobacter sp.]
MKIHITFALALLALPVLAGVELPQATTSLISPTADGITGMGSSQAINDRYILLGAPDFDHTSAQNVGAVYVFSATTRKLIRRIQSPVLVADERFGQTVALFGTTADVGAGGNDTLANNGGAVYAFDIASGRKLWSNQGSQANAGMGTAALAANQDYVLVGIPKGNASGKPTNSGLVRWITRRTGLNVADSVGTSPSANDAYGTALACSGSTVAIGTPYA